ncbi:MAG: FAD:protein FMN transferase [Lysobacterales bacterium]
MKKTVTTLALVLLTLCLQSCSPAPREYHQDFYVFGTLVGVTVWDSDDTRAYAAFNELQQRFQGMHRDWHAWEPGMLTAINDAFARGEAAMANEDILLMIRRAQEYESASGGRFNAAIGGLIRLWGFHTSDYPVLGPPPSAEAIEEWLRRKPSSLDIRIDGATVRSDNPAVMLDFGGIAKGHAIDIACSVLRERGIGNAIVNAGGDLRAIGSHGERPWNIAVRSPGGGVVASIETGRDEAIFTSGNYERFRQDKKERYPHILDPRTGWPVTDLSSVTVITDEGILADAAATAITVAGLADWLEVARNLGTGTVMLIDEHGVVHMTRAMSERVELLKESEVRIYDF